MDPLNPEVHVICQSCGGAGYRLVGNSPEAEEEICDGCSGTGNLALDLEAMKATTTSSYSRASLCSRNTLTVSRTEHGLLIELTGPCFLSFTAAQQLADYLAGSRF